MFITGVERIKSALINMMMVIDIIADLLMKIYYFSQSGHKSKAHCNCVDISAVWRVQVIFFFADFIQRSVLIEGVLFRARYLGSTQLVCEGQPTKTTRMMQAEEAVSRIKVMHAKFQFLNCMHLTNLKINLYKMYFHLHKILIIKKNRT